jgi:predicted short-subunit dehydrogenase-like oxidoreductase (DUF2520 family)
MPQKPSIAIVGPGRLGTALADSLSGAGYHIAEVIPGRTAGSRRHAQELARRVGARVTRGERSNPQADIAWFCVPDREIASAARQFALRTAWKGKIAFHSSGALGSEELAALRQQGARVASVHPLMTFVRGSSPLLEGVPFAIEGDALALRAARQIVRDLGGESFVIRASRKSAYHAWSTFTSPLLLAFLVSSEEVARLAGLSRARARRSMMPIVQQTLANYASLGPDSAFSGPLIRGDAETVARHLNVLRQTPAARQVYLALARSALKHLPAADPKALKRLLTSSQR